MRIPPDASEEKEELTFEEIRKISDEARNMGCRKWSISSGESMLRSDFTEIFEYLTGHSNAYSLNTNGTLITRDLPRLLWRGNSPKKVKITKKYKNHCGSCGLRKDCRICPAYGYLEHRDFNKKIGYLCAVAGESRKFKENWKKTTGVTSKSRG